MYEFKACYFNTVTEKERYTVITLDYPEASERQIFLVAMGKAYDDIKANEIFDYIQFIY